MTWLPLALFALLFAFPPVRTGRGAVHGVIWIYRPQGPFNPDGSVTAFAHVQERGEYRLLKLVALAVGVPFLWLPDSVPVVIGAVVQTAAMILANALAGKVGALDYAGHGAEIMAAERAGVIGYREDEIARMSDDRDKRGDDVGAGLERARWLARVVFVLGRVA